MEVKLHIILKDPTTNQVEGVLCVDRDSNSCQILSGDIERLTELANIGHALKAGQVKLITPAETQEELESLGWKVSPTLIVMTKGSNGR